MVDNYTIESILAADCGTTTTRVFLLDLVDDQYRLVAQGAAPTTIAAPHNDIIIGVVQAIRQIEDLTQRKFLDTETKVIRPERTDGTGVDAFVASVSAGAPLRLLLAGLIPEVSIASARRAVSQANALVEGSVLLSDSRRPEAHVDLIRRLKPEAIVMVGGTEGGAVDGLRALADIITLACQLLRRENRPELVFAGNIEARSLIAEKVAGLMNFHPVDNARPSLDEEEIGPLLEELEHLYSDFKVARVPGFGRLSAWSPVTVLPGSKSYSQTIQFLAESLGLNVVGVSVGSTQTILASVVDGDAVTGIGAGWGVGLGAERVLRDAAPERVSRWVLAEDTTPTDVVDAALTKALYPYSIGLTPLEVETEQAIGREALRLTAERTRSLWPGGSYQPYADLPPLWDLIVMSGKFLTSQPTLGQGVMTLLDGLQPIGVCTLVMDSTGVAETLGVVAAVQPLAAAQVLEHDGLVTLGTLVCPVGTVREGEVAMRAKLTYPDKEVLDLEIAPGTVEVIPLSPGQKASLELRPSRQFDIGWGYKGRGAVAEVEGGILGLVIDARGRPLQVPEDDEERARVLQRWRWGIGY